MNSKTVSKIFGTIYSIVMGCLFWTVAADMMTAESDLKFILGSVLVVVGILLEGCFIYKVWFSK